jgi:hypothetical protein
MTLLRQNGRQSPSSIQAAISAQQDVWRQTSHVPGKMILLQLGLSTLSGGQFKLSSQSFDRLEHPEAQRKNPSIEDETRAMAIEGIRMLHLKTFP